MASTFKFPSFLKLFYLSSVRARKQYVDVLNPKSTGGHSVPSGLFSTLPSSHSAPAIFNPMGFSDGGSDTSQSQEADDSGSRGDNLSQAQTASSMLPPLQENINLAAWAAFTEARLHMA
ncbi:hypothetical protein DPMN_070356 [Dreissena polymorpha]|uniref:Uncharacterized protein n=1 Tax=Dreissena polymorpha TaxID=45954 RepID=A0A9D3Z4Y0_DREPO|nr:hypothetical protein DPMN_070356 [Dreissena polymorpha]